MIEIRNETAESAEIYLSGSIVDDKTGGLIDEWYENSTGYQWPDKIRKQLEGLKGKDLTIYINSDGGSVPAGVAMANMIARHEGHTTAVVEGWCCSIATQVFFSADTRRIPANAYLMIHKPAVYGTGGNADDLRKAAVVLDTIQQGMEEIYRKAALDHVTADDIREMVNAETWLTGTQAASLFDVEELEPMQMAACIGSMKHMKQVPADLRLDHQIRSATDGGSAKGDGDKDRCCEIAAKDYKARAEIALALAKGAMI
ncbi:head maturation protease, ClpP-related [uncultured Selenomonas sp.]|uniref:head maturation protease, ClpP-related n=1 Tax=uncultured Selenomonas sp. TaxID=159275 RepID=UPI0028D39EF6|nr:head maturation protease, ClpP-related [uncultured Selenomonas sp.]